MKQSEKSRQWLDEALVALLRTKPYHSITVTDITEKAGLCRLTFYRNFEDKDDLLRFHFNQRFKLYLSSIQSDDHPVEAKPAPLLAQCFAFWRQEPDIIAGLIKDGCTSILFEPFDRYVQVMLDLLHYNDRISEYQKTFFIGGIFQLMLVWIDNGCQPEPEEIANDLVGLLNYSLLQP